MINMALSAKVIIVFFVIITINLFIIYYATGGNWTLITQPIWRPHYQYVKKPKSVLIDELRTIIMNNVKNKSIMHTALDQLSHINHTLPEQNFLLNQEINDLSKVIKKNVNNETEANSANDHITDIKQTLLDTGPVDNWFQLPDKFERINQNIIYRSFNIVKPEKREKVNVIFMVSSAPARLQRRMAIRETWWSECRTNQRVSIKCVFLTDRKDESTQIGKDLIDEKSQYNDLFFQNLQGGHDFGKRFLLHLVWAMQMYDFDYFLRLDDDYFVCMDRFVSEIPMPPKSLYHWGWIHCQNDIVRPEESIILLSRDVVEKFIGQDPKTMLCHRWADQMIGVWKEILKLPTYYHHDTRLHHDPPAQFIESFKTEQDICTKYIGVHGAYPVQMRTLWKNRGSKNYPKGKTFDDYAPVCSLPNIMKWQNFGPDWIAEPKLCKDNPDWGGTHGTTYIGRQGT